MKYGAVTLGNHQFVIPLNFLERLSEAQFNVVLSSYDVRKTPLKNFITPSVIIEKNGIKIGIIGVCVDVQRFALLSNYQGVYKDPVKTANKLAKKLKKSGCNLVVCLSHLGYDNENTIDDIELAEKSQNIDIIIGGHTHTFLKEADIRNNLQEKSVTIVQAGKSGVYMEKIEILIR